MENLEMSGILIAVSEISGILLKVTEVTAKKSCQEKCLILFIVSCIYLHPFLITLEFVKIFWYPIMHSCIPTLTTDNNTSTDML